jgi:hypothetical protein
MLNRHTIDALNRLLSTLYRSLPMYLTDATPWIHRGDERIVATLRRVVADQKALCARVARFLQDHQAPVDMGDYPMAFTDLHDLSLDYLVSRAIRCQEQAIATIEGVVREVGADAAARTLAEETLGASRAHLEALMELAASVSAPKPAPAV